MLQRQRSFFPLRFPKPDVCHGVPYIPPQVGTHRIFSCFFVTQIELLIIQATWYRHSLGRSAKKEAG